MPKDQLTLMDAFKHAEERRLRWILNCDYKVLESLPRRNFIIRISVNGEGKDEKESFKSWFEE